MGGRSGAAVQAHHTWPCAANSLCARCIDPTLAAEACDTDPTHIDHVTYGGVEGNRQGSPAGSVRGGASQVCEMPSIGEASSSACGAFICGSGVRYVRGATRPAPAGGASPATPHGALHPRDPRMWRQYRCERLAAHAFRRSAGAVLDGWSFGCRHAGAAHPAMRCQRPVRLCCHAPLAAEASATAHAQSNQVTCGGVWGTGTVPPRGA
jgi:hypothetical protein